MPWSGATPPSGGPVGATVGGVGRSRNARADVTEQGVGEVRLAIADPPYLGRADRWYGDGRGGGRTRTDGLWARNGRKPDHHPDAAVWDAPAAHQALIAALERDYDGWVLAGAADSLPVLLAAAPPAAQLAVWSKPNAMSGGARILNRWEPVLVRVPDARRRRESGPRVTDTLHAATRQLGFMGAKPPEWTRWVAAMLGYEPSVDELHDLFAGSGAVASAITTYRQPAESACAFCGSPITQPSTSARRRTCGQACRQRLARRAGVLAGARTTGRPDA